MPGRARPGELEDEVDAPPPARRPRCKKIFLILETLSLLFSGRSQWY